MNVLETFPFRGHFPGIGNLLVAVNRMLDTGEYQLKLPLDPGNPRDFRIRIYASKSSRPTLDLKLPLAEEVSDLRIHKIVELVSSAQKSMSFYFSSDDSSISFVTGGYINNFVAHQPLLDPSKVVHEHTFEFRKSAPGISDVISAMSGLMNGRTEDGYLYSSNITLDGSTCRWLQLHIYYHDNMQATLTLTRQLKTARSKDITELTKLNFAWAHNAPVEISSSDDFHLFVTICEPEDPKRLRNLLNCYSILK